MFIERTFRTLPVMLMTTLLLTPLATAAGGAAPPPGDAAAAIAADSAMQVQSLWDFVLKGGLVMIPIGLCSLIALTIVVERIVSLRRGRIIPSQFLPEIKKILRQHPERRSEALKYCREHQSPLANVMAAGIRRIGSSEEVIERKIEEAGYREQLRLRRFLRGLSVIAALSPLLGLLGTILGMIIAFQTVATSGEALGKAELLATGIYQAMITTAAGLIVAIPVIVCYHWLSSKVDRLVMEMDRLSIEFVEEIAVGGAGRSDREAQTTTTTAASSSPRTAPSAGAPPPDTRPVPAAAATT